MIFHPIVFIYLPRKSESLSLSHTHTHTHIHFAFFSIEMILPTKYKTSKTISQKSPNLLFRQFIFQKLMIVISKIRKRFGPFWMEFIWHYLHLMNLVKLHFVHSRVHKILNGLNPKARLFVSNNFYTLLTKRSCLNKFTKLYSLCN